MLALLGALLVKMDRARARPKRRCAGRSTRRRRSRSRTRTSAICWCRQDRAAEALPYLERATHLDPKLEKAWFNLGKALALLGRGAEADARLREVLRALARAAPDGARGRAPEGRPARGGRAPVSPRAAPQSAQRRCDAAARADRRRGPSTLRRSREPAAAGDRDRAGFPAGDPRSRPAAQGTGPLRRSARVLRPCDRARCRAMRRRTSCARATLAPRLRSRTKPSRPTGAASRCGRGTSAH